jgi:serine/threonine protein phosphatase PrpC
VSSDRLPPDAAKNHRKSKLLLNVMGNSRKDPFITFGQRLGLSPNDTFLLCSDGLWSWFSDNELAAAVARRRPREAAELLIDKARERAAGHGDNCSMAIVRLVAP